MPTIEHDLIESLIREAEEDTKYFCEAILPTMEEQGKLWPYAAASFIERFSPSISLACPIVSTCERGRASRERIFQFYLNLYGKPPLRVKEIHYHDDDLHSREYHKEMEIYLQFVVLGLSDGINDAIEGKYTNLYNSALF